MAPEPVAADATADWTGFEPGSYTVTDGDGNASDYVLNADDTFTMTDSAGTETTGTLAMRDGKGFFTPAGGEELCWTNSQPGADGSWTATADDGTTATVMPATI